MIYLNCAAAVKRQLRAARMVDLHDLAYLGRGRGLTLEDF
jgi:hypothetical protein